MLEVRELGVTYGGTARAVDGLSLTVAGGEVIGLIGANGAGKTSVIDAITGFAAASGSVMLGQREVIGWSPHRRARAGLARTWQQGELFDDLSVRDNLRVGVEPVSLPGVLADAVRPRRRRPPPIVDEVLRRLALASVADSSPMELSQGQRRLVGVARALVSSPRVLLLDEPAAGLSGGETERLGAIVRDVARSGVGVLLVEHDVALVLAVCERIDVLERGRLLASGTPSAIRSNAAVIAAYLGPGAHATQSNVACP